MRINQDKCHFLVSGYKHESIWAQIVDGIIWESNKEKNSRFGNRWKSEV